MSNSKNTTRKLYNVVSMEWRDKTYGNTYVSTVVENSRGRVIHRIPFGYGDGRNNEYKAMEFLKANFNNKALRDNHFLEDVAFITCHKDCLKREVVAHGKGE